MRAQKTFQIYTKIFNLRQVISKNRLIVLRIVEKIYFCMSIYKIMMNCETK